MLSGEGACTNKQEEGSFDYFGLLKDDGAFYMACMELWRNEEVDGIGSQSKINLNSPHNFPLLVYNFFQFIHLLRMNEFQLASLG